MKTGFIRGLWGIFDKSHRITNRRFRVEETIKKTLKIPYSPECKTYVFGKENYKNIESLGVKNIELIEDEPFKFDLIKHQYRHKLELLKYAAEKDGFTEIVYLDWDCFTTREIPTNFWEELRKKEKFQANLMQYCRRKCFWRNIDQRKIPNGGFIYLRDMSLIDKAIYYWEHDKQDNDEIAWAKVTEDLMGGKWTGIQEYWEKFEPKWCNLHRCSPFEESLLHEKQVCFVHRQGTLKI